MIKTAYLVFGIGESTGCKLMTQVIINCGIYGSAKHTQEFQEFMYDNEKFSEQVQEKELNNLVVRQSFPHGSNLPSLYSQYYRLKYSGFEKIYIILTTRSQPAQVISIVDNLHLINNPINDFFLNPVNRIKTAYLKVFGDLSKIENGKFSDFIVVNLNDLSNNPCVNLKYILESINIKIPEQFDYNIVKPDIDKNRYLEIKSEYE